MNRHTGRVNLVESAGDRLASWRATITLLVRNEIARTRYTPPGGGVAVSLTFYLPRPKGHYGTGRNAGTLRPSAPSVPTTRPDIDKLTRAVLDALTNAGALPDDSHVAHLDVRKLYGEPGTPHAEGVAIHVGPISD